jgi:hypothetical protein
MEANGGGTIVWGGVIHPCTDEHLIKPGMRSESCALGLGWWVGSILTTEERNVALKHTSQRKWEEEEEGGGASLCANINGNATVKVYSDHDAGVMTDALLCLPISSYDPSACFPK